MYTAYRVKTKRSRVRIVQGTYDSIEQAEESLGVSFTPSLHLSRMWRERGGGAKGLIIVKGGDL